MAKKVKDDDNWTPPAHSGFEAPMYGEILTEKVGDVGFDAYGNKYVVVEGGGRKIIREWI